MLLQIFNIIIFAILAVLSIQFMSGFSPLLRFIFRIFLFIIFIYSIFYIWIIGKAKPDCRKFDFYSTWGREKINNNLYDYFDEKYAKKYKIISNSVYLIPLVLILIIIVLFWL